MSAPSPWASIPAMAAAAAERHGGLEAVVDGVAPPLTYEALAGEAAGFAAALVRAGIEPGDRVAIWAGNRREWVVAALGLWQAGAVLVPVNTRFKGPEAADVLGRSGARALVTVTDFLGTDYVEMLRAAAPDLPVLETVVVVSGTVPTGAESWAQFLGRADDAARTEAARRAAALGPDDPADILFTSGTTGAPKGVVQTHGRTLLVATDWVAMTGLRAGDRYLMVNPYFHMFGLKAGILACVAAGATMLPEPVFDVERVLARIEQEKVTVLPGPPTLYQSILDHPGRAARDLASLRVAVTGAADIPVELVRRVRDELPFSLVVTGYGLTEATGIATMCRHDDDPETIATTSGRAIPDVEVLVVDEKGAELPRGEPGEIVIRGYNVMQGFIHDPDATAEAIDAGGWLHTGDVGVMDERGYVRITDRTKDMFIVGGFNAYPAEIENMLNEHPAVGSVAVVGVPDPRLGEVGYAFVIPRRDAKITPDELIAWCRDKMANYKVPRYVEIVEAVPLNASGKVLKYALREQAQAQLG